MLNVLTGPDKIDRIAAEEFVSLWEKITSVRPAITTGVSGDSGEDLIVLGMGAENPFLLELMEKESLRPFSFGMDSDEYEIRSVRFEKRNCLILLGGRPRALLYAVYRFFELRASCRYFWDGDIVPERNSIDIRNLDIHEKPRFQYRGLRYFAHRGLSRFQAEHWDFPEWKREIDWILKKRMNVFMLRIGLDDLFQKAFPDIVSYPENYQVPESKPRSFDDRTLFWDLRYRGELRKKVLVYARERDLLHPEDIGTMTHWYSRTPLEFLEKVRPGFLPQCTKSYSEETGKVWDIRKKENLERYFQLTEAHIREYGAPTLFHTIGLAERRCFPDRPRNHQMKLYTYRRIVSRLRESYPNAPLWIASWDFCMYWTPCEVRELAGMLNPANTLIVDYTADNNDEIRNFLNWDLPGRFPWIFGIFHAYEPNSEIRGNYDVLERRLPLAAKDPFCKGLVFWPETSHSDVLMLEYAAANAWDPKPENIVVSDFLETFCAARYQGVLKTKMAKIWRLALPLIRARYWTGATFVSIYPEPLFDPAGTLLDFSHQALANHEFFRPLLEEGLKNAPEIFRRLAQLDWKKTDEFVKRDAVDLAKCVLSRACHAEHIRLALAMEACRNGKESKKEILLRLERLERRFFLFEKVLSAHKDHSLYESLLDLERKHECNPDFENTLKGNVENSYCRSYIAELFPALYEPELRLVSNLIREQLENPPGKAWNFDPERLEKEKVHIRDAFYRTPLRKYHTPCKKAFAALPEVLEELSFMKEE